MRLTCSRRASIVVGLVCALIVSFASAAGAQPAPAKKHVQWRVAAADLEKAPQWVRLREPRFTQGFPWKIENGYLINTAPPGTPYEEVKAMKDGMALSIYGFNEPLPAKMDLSGTFQVDKESAAGFLINAGLDKDALANHYLVLLYHGGVNLWKYTFTGDPANKNKGDYLKLGFRTAALQADSDYVLKITTSLSNAPDRAHGYTISIFLNGEHCFGVTDATPFPPGVIGVWLGEGYAKVKEVEAKY